MNNPDPKKPKIAITGPILIVAVLLGGGSLYAIYAYRNAIESTIDPTPLERPYKDTPFVITPYSVLDKMLELADVKEDEVLYDLGSGDGRIVIRAVEKYGCTAVGFDFDDKLVAESRAKIKELGLEERATIEKQDFFTIDLSKANVIAMYLLPHTIERLRPQLDKLKPGTRVVCHDYGPEWVEYDEKVQVKSDADGSTRFVFLYTWKSP